MIKSVAHACFKTADLQQTRAFYCDPLGMPKRFNFIRSGKVIGFYLKRQ
jgi:catechol 2,3-dioxygenase-like lactoylglutathione lyase family enzyme